LYGSPERVSVVGGSAFAPSSHASAAIASVCRRGETSLPRFIMLVASARHAFAAASVGNVFRIFVPLRRSNTNAR